MKRLALWLIVAFSTFFIGSAVDLLWRNVGTMIIPFAEVELGEADLDRPSADLGRCEVHGTVMRQALVPIYDGLPAIPEISDAYAEAKAALFPNSKQPVAGGCVLGDEQYVEAFVCKKCCEAAAVWERTSSRSRWKLERLHQYRN